MLENEKVAAEKALSIARAWMNEGTLRQLHEGIQLGVYHIDQRDHYSMMHLGHITTSSIEWESLKDSFERVAKDHRPDLYQQPLYSVVSSTDFVGKRTVEVVRDNGVVIVATGYSLYAAESLALSVIGLYRMFIYEGFPRQQNYNSALELD